MFFENKVAVELPRSEFVEAQEQDDLFYLYLKSRSPCSSSKAGVQQIDFAIYKETPACSCG